MADDLKPGAGAETTPEPTPPAATGAEPEITVSEDAPVAQSDPDQVEMMHDLISDFESPAGEQGQEQTPTTPADGGRDAKVGREPSTKERKAGTDVPGPDDGTYKSFVYSKNGQDFHAYYRTPEELESLKAMATSSEQLPHLQRLYDEKLKADAAAAAEASTTPRGAAPPRQESLADLASLPADKWIERWAPLVDQMKTNGLFGDDEAVFEILPPRVRVQMALIEAIGMPLLMGFNEVKKQVDEITWERQATGFFSRMDGLFDQLSKRGPVYEALENNNDMRHRFFRHLQAVSPTEEQLFDLDYLAGQFRAMPDTLQVAEKLERENAKSQKQRRESELRRGSAASYRGGASGRHTPPPPEPTGQAALMKKLIEEAEGR